MHLRGSGMANMVPIGTTSSKERLSSITNSLHTAQPHTMAMCAACVTPPTEHQNPTLPMTPEMWCDAVRCRDDAFDQAVTA